MRFRFAEQDHDEYGGEWFEIDPYGLQDVEVGLLEEIEEATGYTVLHELPAELKRRSVKAMRALMWIAVRMSGQVTPWREFKPAVLKASWTADAEVVAAARAGDEEQADGRGEAPGPNRATRRAAAKPAKAATSSTRRSGARSARSSTSTTSGSARSSDSTPATSAG